MGEEYTPIPNPEQRRQAEQEEKDEAVYGLGLEEKYKLALERSAYTGAHRQYLEKEKSRLEVEVGIDHLTGLPNRRALDGTLAKYWDEMIRNGREHDLKEMVLIFVDLDRFKLINDTYGHQFADTALFQFAAVLKESVRSTDFVARYGGDEMVIIMRNVDMATATKHTEDIRAKVAALEFDNGAKITASFGLAGSQEASSPAEFLAKAEKAHYQAKQGGKNRVQVSDTSR